MVKGKTEQWQNLLVDAAQSIHSAIEILQDEPQKIVLVVDANRRLLGTITDGDIRRGLLCHISIQSKVTEVMFSASKTALISESQENILRVMRENDLFHVPLLDDEGVVVGLETEEHLVQCKRIENLVFLMAGGFGKRLYPLTEELPKPLLEVGGRPILETILRQFIDEGFYKFSISTHYKAELIQKYFGDGSQWGSEISYIQEQEPLGTAGALGLLPNDISTRPLVMMNCDLLTNIDFRHLLRFHDEQGGKATVCVWEYDFQVPYGVISTDNGFVKKIEEKPLQQFFVNAGIYILEPDLLRGLNGKESIDMPEFLSQQMDLGHKIAVYPLHEYWLDIGRMEDFSRAQIDVSKVIKK